MEGGLQYEHNTSGFAWTRAHCTGFTKQTTLGLCWEFGFKDPIKWDPYIGLNGIRGGFVRFEILTSVTMKEFYITSCSPIKVNRSFWVTYVYCVHLQDRRISWATVFATCFLRWFVVRIITRHWRRRQYAPPKRRLNFNELHVLICQKLILFMSINVCQTTWRRKAEVNILHSQHRETLESQQDGRDGVRTGVHLPPSAFFHLGFMNTSEQL
jgi:hypothetical protein